MANNTTRGMNMNRRGVQMMTYDAPTDEELYAQAALAADENYRTDYDLLFSQTKNKKNVMAQAIRDAESDYSDAMQSLEKEYESASKALSEEALARGLGRSSYALDLQNENLNDKQESLSAMMADKMQAVNVIQNQIDMLEQEFIDKQTYLSKKKEDELKSILANLREDRDETLREVLEYNNELIMDQKGLAIKRLKAQRDSAIKRAKSSSRTAGAESGQDRKPTPKSLMSEYTSLTGAGKLKFFNENQEAMKSMLDIGTYKNVLREIYAFIEQGVKPATGTDENYYK